MNKKENKKLKFFIIIIMILFFILIIELFKVIIIKKDFYNKSIKNISSSIVYGDSAPRGRIYDRNHKLLVDNKSIPVIIYEKKKKITSSEEIELSYTISKNIDIDYKKLSKTNLKEFWIIQNKDKAYKLITEDEWKKLKNRIITQEDIKKYKLDRISDVELNKYNTLDKKAAYIYYLMNKGYSYEKKIIKDENISEKEYAYIAEHKDILNGFDVSYKWEREYIYGDTFRNILGNVSNISFENKKEYLSNGYSLNDIVGVSYIEKQYESILKGTKDKYLLKNNELTLINYGKKGNDIVLSIDIDLQKSIEKILKKEILKAKKEPATKYYSSSYVIIQDPSTGEILAMSGMKVKKINNKYKIYDVTEEILTNAITPGSVVKGASMMVGYQTKAIKIGEKQTDSCIKIYSKPEKCSWKKLGLINDIDALAYSSNIYQFKTAMKVDKFNYRYNAKFNVKESTFNTYRSIFNEFGLGVKTGIDLPIESVGNIGKNYSSDLLLNFSIGQYDTYTAMQLSQYITTIANSGKRMKPHLLKEIYNGSLNESNKEEITPTILNTLSGDKKYLNRIKKGFKAVLSYGIGKNIMGKIKKPSGKTGTSESFLDTNNDGIIDTETLTNAFVGYAPYDNPVMSITVISPNLVDPNSKSSSRSYLNHRLSRLISEKFFEIYNKN